MPPLQEKAAGVAAKQPRTMGKPISVVPLQRKKRSYSDLFFIIRRRAIFPGVDPKYCNRGEA